MTALPEAVEWEPPRPGLLDAQLPARGVAARGDDPVVRRLAARADRGRLPATGCDPRWAPPSPSGYAAINGWYYTTLPEVSPRLLARALLESRGRMVPIMWNALIRVNNDPVGADRAVLRRLADEWSNELLPRYRRWSPAPRSG